MTRRIRWSAEIVQRARLLHSRGLGYISISRALADEFVEAPSWNTVRDWCACRTRGAA